MRTKFTILVVLTILILFGFYQILKNNFSTLSDGIVSMSSISAVTEQNISEKQNEYESKDSILIVQKQVKKNRFDGRLAYRESNCFVFSFYLDREISNDEQVYIEYDYWGVARSHNIVRSINDNVGFGGLAYEKDSLWKHHKESINQALLKKGENIVRFIMPIEVSERFIVKNIKLTIDKHEQFNDTREIVIDDEEGIFYNGKYLYVKGFLRGKGSKEAKIYVNGQLARANMGEFEKIIAIKREFNKEFEELIIEAHYADGEIIKREKIKENTSTGYEKINLSNYSESIPRVSKQVNPREDFKLSLGTAVIEGEINSILKPIDLSITSLQSKDFASLKSGMKNLTSEADAYRFLPHGTKFEQDVSIKIGFDSTKIPSGYSVKDIVTYYFDEQLGTWIALEKDSIDYANSMVVSKTNHFTDFINAIIQVPESPDVNAFVPTSLKDVAFADPIAGLNIISPASANNSGTNNLTFPIIIPPGRQGMQPQLALSYSSDAGNSWLGIGWNLSLPAITVETRWGVPRYSLTQETEGYLINGEQIVQLEINHTDTTRLPLVHMQAYRNRPSSSMTYFSYRIEGAFHRIIRHGNSPLNYWWEVIDKQGTRYFYGKYSTDGGFNDLCGLKGPNGIAHWALAEVRDVHGNYVRYEYDYEICNTTPPINRRMQLTPKKIVYTSHASLQGIYNVEFVTNNTPEYTISGKYGFLVYNNKLLDNIIIRHGNEFVRTYAFLYKEGAYKKKLMCSLAEITDSNNISAWRESINCYNKDSLPIGVEQLFKMHFFDYFEEEGLNFRNPITITDLTEDKEKILAGLYTDPVQQSIGRSLSTSVSKGGSLSFGLFSDVAKKTNSLGVNVGHSLGTNKEKVQLMDLNGDGLIDKIVKKNNKYHFYEGKLGSNNVYYLDHNYVVINTLPSFTTSFSSSKSLGFELQFGIPKINGTISLTGSSTDQLNSGYFADVNADGYIDYVRTNASNQSEVYYNFPVNKKPRFLMTCGPIITNPLDSCYNITVGGEPIDSIFRVYEYDDTLFSKRDPVKVWYAPNKELGCVFIYNNIKRIKQDSFNNNTIYYSIQVSDSVIFCDSIPHFDTNQRLDTLCFNLAQHVNVNKRDKVFFRLHSNTNTGFDDVYWDPIIRLTSGVCADPAQHDDYGCDANEKHLNNYQYSVDALMHDHRVFVAPFDGVVELKSHISSTEQSDNLNYLIIHQGNSLLDTIFSHSVHFINDTIFEIHVKEGDKILYNLKSYTNVNWNKIDFVARIRYLSANVGNGFVVDTAVSSYRIDHYPSLKMEVFPNSVYRSKGYFLKAGTYELAPVINLTSGSQASGVITFSAKTKNHLLNKKNLEYVNGTLQTSNNNISFDLVKEDTVYFDFHTRVTELAYDIALLEALDINDKSKYQAGLFSQFGLKDKVYGPLNRGWGQFSYLHKNSNVCTPIDLNNLNNDILIDTNAIANFLIGLDSNSFNFATLMNGFFALGFPTPNKLPFASMRANRELNKWIDFSQNTYVDPENMGIGFSSHMLSYMLNDTSIFEPDDIEIIPDLHNPVPTSNSCGGPSYTINKKSKQTSYTVSISTKFQITDGSSASDTVNLSLGRSFTTTHSKAYTDYMDMNGDRYPDIVGHKKIQYTSPNGSLSATKLTISDILVSKSESKAEGKSFGMKPVEFAAKKTSSPSKSKMDNIIGPPGLSNTEGSSVNEIIYIDINGDGLPDRITNGNTSSVWLNLGYDFISNSVSWRPLEFSDNNTSSNSISMPLTSFNTAESSWSGGIAGNENISFENKTFMDINNDGLIDVCYVMFVNGSHCLFAHINMGNSFHGPFNMGSIGANHLNFNSTRNIGANLAATLGVSLTPFLKVTGSGYLDVSYSISTDEYRFMDLNGDSFLDFVYIENNVVKAKLGVPKKVNIMKEVVTPSKSKYIFDYTRSMPTFEDPSSKWLFTSSKIYDGFTGDGGQDTMYYKYSYSKSKHHLMERDNFGFDTVTTSQFDNFGTNSICYRKTIEIFHNNNFLFKNLKKQESMYNENNHLYMSKTYEWLRKEISSGEIVDMNMAHCFGPYFPALHEENTRYFGSSLSNQVHTRKQYIHGPHGNIITYNNFNNVGNNHDDLIAKLTYTYDLTNHLTAMVDELRVYCSNQTLLQHRKAQYQANTGKINKISTFNGASFVDTDIYYDVYGNMSKIEYPANYINKRFSYQITYDSSHKAYLASVTDVFGNSSRIYYNYKFGKPIKIIDMAGNTMEYTYYSDGKPKTVLAPNELQQGLPYTIMFDYWDESISNNSYRWAKTKHYDSFISGNEFETKTISDGIGRVVQSKVKASVNGVDNIIVSGKNIYDPYGRIIQTGQPTAVALGNMNNYTPIQLINPTYTTYDVLDRPLKNVAPDNTEVKFTYSIDTDPFGNICYKTEIKDQNGNITTEFKDSRGLQTAIMSPLQFTTKFTYSALGQLLVSIDPEDNITSYEYDMLGRLIQRVHPDAGQTIMQYDNAGNLIAKQNQNQVEQGVVVEYDYDFNRLIGIRYPNNPAQNIKYQYGAPNTGNQSGRLILQEDASGIQQFFYGNLGEVIKNIRTFVMPNSNPLTFAMEYKYDSFNRIMQMTYPDGERVNYEYDLGGQLKSVWGAKETEGGTETSIYVENIKYDEYGSRSEILYGNGIKTTYTYEPLRRRLVHLQGVDLNTNEIIQNIEFNYDNADNIIGVQKSADRSVEGHSYNYQMNYDYDNLYRLTGANGYLQGLSSGDAYLNEYHLSYSPSGNILTKSVNAQILTTSGTQNVESYYQYSYESRPHTISNITGSSKIEFEWDGSGNMTKMYKHDRELRRRMNWDEENRLKGVYDSEQRLSSYLYDAVGERSLKLSGYYQNMLINANHSINYINLDQFTLYTSPYMVLTESEYTKHYYIESDRIASKIGGGMANAIHDVNKIVLGFDITCENTFNAKTHEVDLMMRKDFEQLEVGVDVDLDIDVSFWLDKALEESRSEFLLYYYHKDHLGSSTQITDRNANITHHLEYMPFGEPFVEQRKDWGTDYKFTSKELDSETGLYYFGARYYSSDLSVWLSVDPLSDKYPSMSAFMYCAGNPLKFVDPDGREIWIFREDGNKTQYQPGMSCEGLDEFTTNTILALEQAMTHNESAQKIQSLVDDKETNFNIVKTTKISGYDVSIGQWTTREGVKMSMLAKNQTIRFNVLMGLEDKNSGETLAPFIALFHELGHAYNAQQNTVTFDNRRNDKSEAKLWRDSEEKYNIQNYEIPLSRFYSMLERQNYSNDYKPIITKGVLTNEKLKDY